LFNLDKKIDIHAEDDYAFRRSCDKNRLEVAKWLCTLSNRYSYIINKDKTISCNIKTDKELKNELILKFGGNMLNCKKYFDLVFN